MPRSFCTDDIAQIWCSFCTQLNETERRGSSQLDMFRFAKIALLTGASSDANKGTGSFPRRAKKSKILANGPEISGHFQHLKIAAMTGSEKRAPRLQGPIRSHFSPRDGVQALFVVFLAIRDSRLHCVSYVSFNLFLHRNICKSPRDLLASTQTAEREKKTRYDKHLSPI